MVAYTQTRAEFLGSFVKYDVLNFQFEKIKNSKRKKERPERCCSAVIE